MSLPKILNLNGLQKEEYAARVVKLAEALTIAVEAHESIAKNSCCDKCQEAKLVSKDALRRIKEMGK